MGCQLRSYRHYTGKKPQHGEQGLWEDSNPCHRAFGPSGRPCSGKMTSSSEGVYSAHMGFFSILLSKGGLRSGPRVCSQVRSGMVLLEIRLLYSQHRSNAVLSNGDFPGDYSWFLLLHLNEAAVLSQFPLFLSDEWRWQAIVNNLFYKLYLTGV